MCCKRFLYTWPLLFTSTSLHLTSTLVHFTSTLEVYYYRFRLFASFTPLPLNAITLYCVFGYALYPQTCPKVPSTSVLHYHIAALQYTVLNQFSVSTSLLLFQLNQSSLLLGHYDFLTWLDKRSKAQDLPLTSYFKTYISDSQSSIHIMLDAKQFTFAKHSVSYWFEILYYITVLYFNYNSSNFSIHPPKHQNTPTSIIFSPFPVFQLGRVKKKSV